MLFYVLQYLFQLKQNSKFMLAIIAAEARADNVAYSSVLVVKFNLIDVPTFNNCISS